MSLIQRVPGADFSGSGLPTLVRTRMGFPVTGLRALYLFEDGAAGEAYTGTGGLVTDSSGNAAHATIATGSAATKTAEGISTGESLSSGFMAKTPLDYDDSFHMVIVARNRTPPGTSISYPGIHFNSANCSAGAAAITEGLMWANQAEHGQLYLNHDSLYNTAPVNTWPEVGLINRVSGSTSATPWSGASARVSAALATPPKAQFIATALSVNAADGHVLARSMGMSMEVTSPTHCAALLAAAGKHVFGFAHYAAALDSVMGDVGLAGFWSGAADETALDDLNARAKVRMALRGAAAI
jgi:hypothetical protein